MAAAQWLLSKDFCASQNVTYDHRVFNPDAHNWCLVPEGGADALLFAALAVFCACALYSRLSAMWVLCAGACFELLSFHLNLGHFSNAVTLWLGMHPPFLFFQAFLPPLLLDSAVRIDFFLFRKMAPHVLLFAFVNVVVSAMAFIPLMLYGLGLAKHGWRAIDAALFGAMLGSTDAVAVTAILKAGGAPEMLSTLLEGESLFNDASSIVLFEVFLALSSMPVSPSLKSQAGHIALEIAWLAGAGAVCGMLMGLVTKMLLKFLHKRHVPPHAEVAVSLAGSYTAYLCTEYYVHGSGVIAVVMYGLYGASSFIYGLSAKGTRQGSFFKFWDVASFITNGMVFFFVGVSITNFFLSVSEELFQGGSGAALLQTLQGLPLIIAAMFLLRWGLMWLEAPLLSLVGNCNLTWQEVLFSTVGGLRGGLALILAQTVLAGHSSTQSEELKVIHAQMTLWVAGFVLFTLLVNAPSLGPLMNWLGLNDCTPLQRQMRRRAHMVLTNYTKRTIADLQADDDELLRGVDWAAVQADADINEDVKHALKAAESMMKRDAEQQQGAEHARGTATDKQPAGVPKSAGLTTPLLAAEADVEAGQPVAKKDLTDVVALSKSEAVFISARVQAQEQQLAAHTAVAPEQPLYNSSAISDAGTADTAEAELAGTSEGEDDGLPVQIEDHVSGYSDDIGSEHGSTTTTGSFAEPPAPKLRELSPLIVVRVPVSAARAYAAFSSGISQTGLRPPAAAASGRSFTAAPQLYAAVGSMSMARRGNTQLLGGAWGQGMEPKLPSVPDTMTDTHMNGTAAPARRVALKGSRALSGSESFARSLDLEEAMSEASEDMGAISAEAHLEECRTTLLAGFKRHFRFKAAEGLLATTSLRVLSYACDAELLRLNQPIDLWSRIAADVRNRGFSGYLVGLHLQLRRWQATLLRIPGGNLVRWLLLPPLQSASHSLGQHLGRDAVVSLEVAMELWLALTASPHAKLMRHSHNPGAALLQEELHEQAEAVWRFITQRQVEAPDEFAALQTYRVQLAVARRQLAFVERMAEVGIVEEAASEALLELVEHRLHKLESRGPNLQPIGVMDALRKQPCLASAPEPLLLWLRAYAELKSYAPGQCIVPRRRSGPMGIFIVLAGLVRADVVRNGSKESRFVGTGGSIGFIGAMLGRDLPGVSLVAAYAQGSALGRGPLVLHLPMRLLDTIRQRAAPAENTSGCTTIDERVPAAVAHNPDAAQAASFAQLLLDMYRQAGTMLLDRMADAISQQLMLHVEKAAQAVLDYTTQLPSGQSVATLQHLLDNLLDTAAAPLDLTQLGIGIDTDGSSSLDDPAAVAATGEVEGLGAVSAGEAALLVMRQRAATAAKLLRDLFRGAELVRLAAGAEFTQTTSLLLMDGALHMQPHSSTAFEGGSSVSSITTAEQHPTKRGLFGRKRAPGSPGTSSPVPASVSSGGAADQGVPLLHVKAPTVLAWGPQLFGSVDGRYKTGTRTFVAGQSGALLLVTAGGDDSAASSATATAAFAPKGVASVTGVGPAAALPDRDEAVGTGRRGLQKLASFVPLTRTVAATLEPDGDSA